MPGNQVQGKERPAYAINSVDVALQLAALIQLEGSITTTRAAERLNIAQSTAHRMLAMLVYRDFAVKDGHTYRIGPVLQTSSSESVAISLLREVAAVPMTGLDDLFDETTTLSIRSGRTVRILAEIECSHQLRVGHRTGMAMAAHLSVAGIALLSQMPEPEIIRLYAPQELRRDEPAPVMSGLLAQTAKARENGFYFDNGNISKGIASIACPVMYPTDVPVAALSVSMPSSRFKASELGSIVAGIRSAGRQIELELHLNARRQSVGHLDADGVREQLVV